MKTKTALESSRAACLLLLRTFFRTAPHLRIASDATLPQDGRSATGRRPVLLMLNRILRLSGFRRNPILFAKALHPPLQHVPLWVHPRLRRQKQFTSVEITK